MAIRKTICMTKRRRSFGKKRTQSTKQLFVGRKEQLQRFERNLELGPDSDEFLNIFNVFGQGGVGKTYLVTRYREMAEKAGYLTAFVDTEDRRLFEVTATMNAIANALTQKDAPFKRFAKRYKDYLQEKGKLENDPDRPKGTLGKLISTSIKLGAKASAEFVPGGGIVREYLPVDTVAEVAGEWANFAWQKLGNKDEVELVLQPLQVLTPLWIEDLYDYADKQNLALFFDTYETANPELDQWLYELLNGQFGDIPDNILFIISGREALDPTCWNTFREYTEKISLEPFTEAEAREYLEQKGISSKSSIEAILSISGRLPVYLSLLAEGDPISTDNLADPNEKVVDRFLNHIQEPLKRQLALRAALPRKLNKDVVTCLLPQSSEADAFALFEWLKKRPFVQQRGGHWAYHPTVRETMLRYQKAFSESDWEALHSKLAQFYQNRIEHMQLEDRIDQLTDEQCFAYHIEKCYHQLCENYNNAIPIGVRGFVTTLRISTDAQTFPWVTIVIEAEAFFPGKEWGKILQEGLAQIISDEKQGEQATRLINSSCDE